MNMLVRGLDNEAGASATLRAPTAAVDNARATNHATRRERTRQSPRMAERIVVAGARWTRVAQSSQHRVKSARGYCRLYWQMRVQSCRLKLGVGDCGGFRLRRALA